MHASKSSNSIVQFWIQYVQYNAFPGATLRERQKWHPPFCGARIKCLSRLQAGDTWLNRYGLGKQLTHRFAKNHAERASQVKVIGYDPHSHCTTIISGSMCCLALCYKRNIAKDGNSVVSVKLSIIKWGVQMFLRLGPTSRSRPVNSSPEPCPLWDRRIHCGTVGRYFLRAWCYLAPVCNPPSSRWPPRTFIHKIRVFISLISIMK